SGEDEPENIVAKTDVENLARSARHASRDRNSLPQIFGIYFFGKWAVEKASRRSFRVIALASKNLRSGLICVWTADVDFTIFFVSSFPGLPSHSLLDPTVSWFHNVLSLP